MKYQNFLINSYGSYETFGLDSLYINWDEFNLVDFIGDISICIDRILFLLRMGYVSLNVFMNFPLISLSLNPPLL